ncbi:alpha-L-fucosidase [uncultured Parabacteroides sp.]|uniref:alpha-L-fucosidase n=1 Tax=uncultured Parabacteroides sp. TaxID=512312 RepID=UPI00259B7F50|nr:alpha-L-fucosidase [uncultured Parabacteroides sp.]
MKNLIVSVVCAVCLTTPVLGQERMDKMWGDQRAKNIEAKGERGHLFEWGNYAMFIHWGLFSHLGNVWNGKTYYGIGEWMMDVNMANADKNEYKAVARSFDPKDFDAMKIANLAKEAGMKYIIITSKHHDGFAMFHSQCDKFNIVDATPFGRDPMKELAEACKKIGLGFGFYYSHNQDWTTPGASGAAKVDAEGNTKTFDDYFNRKCLPQVEEITRNYGDIELIWFDTPGGIPQKYAQKLVDVVHRNQPRALVSGRVGYNLGDYQTLGDMEVPLENIDGLWESVDVTNDVWGYAWYDQNWKSPKLILKNLISTIARGGTYMLNIGPDGKGNVPGFVSQALHSSGKWIARYPQVVYGAESSPWKHALPWGDIVKQGNKLYLIVYEWPDSGRLYLPGLKSEIKSASILNGERVQRIKFEKEGSWTIFQVPYHQPDPLVSVIELVIDKLVSVDNTQAVDPEIGIKDLSVKFATPVGCHVYKSSWMEKFGEWKHVFCSSDLGQGGSIDWTIEVKEAGVYQVDLKARGTGRAVWMIKTDEGHTLQNQQGVSSIFCERPMGWIRFDKPGKHMISVSMPEGGQVDLASISLTPIYF